MVIGKYLQAVNLFRRSKGTLVEILQQPLKIRTVFVHTPECTVNIICAKIRQLYAVGKIAFDEEGHLNDVF